MKKGYVKLLTISLVMAIILIINSVTGLFSLVTYSLFLLFSFLIVKKIMGFESDDFPNKQEIIIVLASGVLIYYGITYLAVFFWGIVENRVGLTFTSLINNIIPFFLIIIFTELIRYIVIRKGRGYKSIWVVAVLLFSLMEITLKTRGYDFDVGIQVLKFSLEVVAVSIVKNIFLCYLTYRAGYKPAIIFRSLYELPLYILPFFPYLEIFIDSIAKMILPATLLFILLYRYTNPDKKAKKISEKQAKIYRTIGYVIVIIFAAVVVGLSSMKFRYFTIVVGSGSMSPNINKGDVVLVKKVRDINVLNENDILIFKYENTTVIHRIVRIEQEGYEILFYTKGDANESEDYYPVKKDEIIGTSIFKIKYIGYPTVWISDKLK